MTVEIVFSRPPNYDRVLEAFPRAADKGVIFAYSPKIYVPTGGGRISEALYQHELVHMEQQGGNPEFWWERYIADPKFRLEQEIPAHAAEYRQIRKQVSDRNQLSKWLSAIAMKLAGPLYGNLVTVGEARRLVAA